jgi:hypothetical protein
MTEAHEKKKKRQQSEEHGRSKKLGMVFLEHRDRERQRQRGSDELDPET